MALIKLIIWIAGMGFSILLGLYFRSVSSDETLGWVIGFIGAVCITIWFLTSAEFDDEDEL